MGRPAASQATADALARAAFLPGLPWVEGGRATTIRAVADQAPTATAQLHAAAPVVEGVVNRSEVFAAIDRERAWQEHKWGTIAEHPHTVAEWLLIVEAELAEAKQGWVKGQGDHDALRELVQVAAVAVAALEQHGARERPWPALGKAPLTRIRWERQFVEEG